jgi:hypothetical protein
MVLSVYKAIISKMDFAIFKSVFHLLLQMAVQPKHIKHPNVYENPIVDLPYQGKING